MTAERTTAEEPVRILTELLEDWKNDFDHAYQYAEQGCVSTTGRTIDQCERNIRGLSAAIAALTEAGKATADDDFTLNELHYQDGQLQVGMASKMVPVLAEGLAAFLDGDNDHNAFCVNYCEMALRNPKTLKEYVVTVQRGGNPTPHTLRMQAEAELDTLRRDRDQVHEMLLNWCVLEGDPLDGNESTVALLNNIRGAIMPRMSAHLELIDELRSDRDARARDQERLDAISHGEIVLESMGTTVEYYNVTNKRGGLFTTADGTTLRDAIDAAIQDAARGAVGEGNG